MKRRLKILLIFLLFFVYDADFAPCDIKGGRYELILDVTESLGQAFDQPILPEELPIEGDVGAEIDLVLSDQVGQRFLLDGKRLTLSRPLDREEEKSSTLRFEVSCTVKSSAQTRSIPVVLRVGDINDNPPEFVGAPYHIAIKEDAKVGFPIFTGIEARDTDSGQNGQVEYEIVRDSPDGDGDGREFSVRFPHQGVVFLDSPLDYETKPLYRIHILAKDYASDPGKRLNSTTTLTIRVQDVDDQDPVFDTASHNCSSEDPGTANCLPEYHSSVIEGQISGVLDIYPGRIRAKDVDALGASVSYSFISGTPSSFEDYFKIDARTAVVTQIKKVDRTMIKSFDIVIQAVESTPRRGRSSARLQILVQKVDTSPPKLVIPAYRGKVPEASAPGTPVLKEDNSGEPFVLSVFDPDVEPGEPPPKYVFELTTNSFKVTEEGALVVAVPSLDRDPPNLSEHTFQAIAREDREGGRASAPVALTVRLLDINDNPPRLPIIPAVTFPAGSDHRDVIQVQAKDADEGENAVPKYKLLSGGRDKFTIDADTGVISSVGNLIAGENFFLNIQATDIGNLSSEGFVEIVISRGPNTDGPIFSRPRYSVIVPEDVPHGEQIIEVKAKDPENDSSYYSIVGGDGGKSFEIDTLSGVITVVAPLDREKQSEHTLVVKAEDSEGKSNTASVLVQVTDVNDEYPRFIGEPYSFRVDEGLLDSSVGVVEAEDKDLGVFGEVSYLIVEGNTPQFKIDSRSGEIFTNLSLDYEKEQVHYVSVVAHDHADDPRSSTTTVTVLVNDVPDEDPFFPQHVYHTQVKENTDVGSVLVIVEAIDKDTVPSITYKLIEGDPDLFKVAPDSGRVTLAGSLDYEVKPNYTLVISTQENQDLTPGRVTRVEVEVEDVNDESPILEELHTVTLPKEAPPGTLLTQVIATDADGTYPNNKVKFELEKDSMTSSYFDIDQDTGEIRLSKSLRDVNDTELSIQITTMDGGNPPHSSSETLQILILEGVKEALQEPSVSGVLQAPSSVGGVRGKVSVGASAPRFSNNEFELEVNENVPLGSVVAKVPLTNTTTSAVKCSITHGDEEGTFKTKITEDGNCKIISSKNLDFEMNPSFNLTLGLYPQGFTLTNGQETPVLSRASIFIMVKDVNDNSPKFKLSGFDMLQGFEKTTVLSYVLQDSPVDTKVLHIQAVDSDSGDWGSISYQLLPESNRGNYFSVDQDTGTVFLKRKLRDVPLELLPFNLSLVATDEPGQDGTKHQSILNIIIPVIEESHQWILILEESKEKVKEEVESIQDSLSRSSGKKVQIEEISQTRKGRKKEANLWFHLLDPETYLPLNPRDFYEKEEESEKTLRDITLGSNHITPLRLTSPKLLLQESGDLSAKGKNKESLREKNSKGGSVGMVKVEGASPLALTTLEYALIVLSGVIIVFVLCAIVVVCILWSRFSKKWNSADKTVMLVPPVIDRPASVLESVSKEYEVQVLHMSVPLDDDSVQEGAVEPDSPRQPYLDNVSYISKSRNGLEGSSSGRSSGVVTPSGLVVEDHNGVGNFSNWSPETPTRDGGGGGGGADHFSSTHLDSNDPNALSASVTNSNVMFGRRGFQDMSAVETTTEL